MARAPPSLAVCLRAHRRAVSPLFLQTRSMISWRYGASMRPAPGEPACRVPRPLEHLVDERCLDAHPLVLRDDRVQPSSGPDRIAASGGQAWRGPDDHVRSLDGWNAIVPEDERMGIETALVDEVLEEVAAPEEPVRRAQVASRRRTFQLIMERVWRKSGLTARRCCAQKHCDGSGEHAPSQHPLERALVALPPPRSRDSDERAQVSGHSVPHQIAHSLGDLVDYTDESPVEIAGGARTARIAAESAIHLRGMADDGRRYEIFHDVLAEPVLAWRREFDTRAALERERAVRGRRHRRLLAIAGGAACPRRLMIVLADTRSRSARRGRESSGMRPQAHAQAERAQRLTAQRQRSVGGRASRRAVSRKARRIVQRQQPVTARCGLRRAGQAKRSEDAAKRSAGQASRARRSRSTAAHREGQLVAARTKAGGAGAAAARRCMRPRSSSDPARALPRVVDADAKLDVDPGSESPCGPRGSDPRCGPPVSNDRVEDALRSSLRGAAPARDPRGRGWPGERSRLQPRRKPRGNGVRRGLPCASSRPARMPLRRTLKVRSPIATVAFSPDGKTLAAAARDGRALLYDVESGDLLRTLHHDGRVLTLAFAGGGRYLVHGEHRRHAADLGHGNRRSPARRLRPRSDRDRGDQPPAARSRSLFRRATPSHASTTWRAASWSQASNSRVK